jgi:nitrate reductase NapE
VTEITDRKTERRAFIFLVVFAAPAMAVAIVGGYGFAVWFSQILLGPPGA